MDCQHWLSLISKSPCSTPCIFLNSYRNRVKILYWGRNGFCLWLGRLEAKRFKTSHNSQKSIMSPLTQKHF
ncbi:transposase [Pseudomonas syringae]|uniref:transposase n=1 Tax=Pseudomonas syringae TaxID=317 RepID=UPI001F2A57A5|nr:transposase [Pseudomonas syringae]